jgi:aminocarboxymuconate-semialdehyde decarboxylase
VIIDTHAHFTPEAMLKALQGAAGKFPNIELLAKDNNFRLAFAGNAPTRPVAPKLRETTERLAWMDKSGIDAQVCGGWLDSFGYELPAEEGANWSRFVNEHLMAGTDTTKRLAPLATVPLQNGKLAAKVLEEAMAAGFAGAMIGTQPKGASGTLDDPDLDAFWEAASSLKAVIYLHPMFGCGDTRLDDYDMINAVGRGVDTTTAIARMLFSGHFLKYPDMKFVLSHGGGALPYMLGRLERNRDIHPGEYADPAAGFAKLYFDSVLFSWQSLRFLTKVVGPEKVMLGSDYPFPIGDPDPCKVVRAARLTDAEQSLVLGDTAQKIFKIK